MPNHKVLFVLTGHDRLGEADDEQAEKTGFHLYEAAKPWAVLTDAGIDVELATPAGGNAPIDPSSRDLDNDVNARFINDPRVNTAIDYSAALGDVDLNEFDAIYFPGGHGTMWDLPDDESVHAAVQAMFKQGKVIAAVCHGPAALVNAKGPDGNWLVNGKTVAAFTDDEERETGKDTVMPFPLASTLEKRGAKLSQSANFESAVAVDGRLVTGQNPASADGVGAAIRDLLLRKAVEAA